MSLKYEPASVPRHILPGKEGASSLLGPVVPSFRTLYGRHKFTVRRGKFNKGSLLRERTADVLWREKCTALGGSLAVRTPHLQGIRRSVRTTHLQRVNSRFTHVHLAVAVHLQVAVCPSTWTHPEENIRANGSSQKWTRPGMPPDSGGILRGCPNQVAFLDGSTFGRCHLP